MHVHFLYEPKLTEHMADLFLQYGVTSVPIPAATGNWLS